MRAENIEQINVFYPSIICINGNFVQSIRTEAYVENPVTKRWHVVQYNYPSGKNWRAFIGNINCQDYCKKNPSIHVTKYENYQQFFRVTDRNSICTPITSKHTYLTATGATRHNLFYALVVEDKCRYIGLAQTLDGCVKPEQQETVPVQLMPNGRIVPLAPGTTLPKRFETVYNTKEPSEIGTSNLHKAQQALKSDSPDAALLLLSLMVEISMQSFGDILPGVDITLGGFIDSQVHEVDNNGKWRIAPTQMRMLHTLFRESQGWWDWIWDANSNFRPIFTPYTF